MEVFRVSRGGTRCILGGQGERGWSLMERCRCQQHPLGVPDLLGICVNGFLNSVIPREARNLGGGLCRPDPHSLVVPKMLVHTDLIRTPSFLLSLLWVLLRKLVGNTDIYDMKAHPLWWHSTLSESPRLPSQANCLRSHQAWRAMTCLAHLSR